MRWGVSPSGRPRRAQGLGQEATTSGNVSPSEAITLRDEPAFGAAFRPGSRPKKNAPTARRASRTGTATAVEPSAYNCAPQTL